MGGTTQVKEDNTPDSSPKEQFAGKQKGKTH
jgi:hypothetical protein